MRTSPGVTSGEGVGVGRKTGEPHPSSDVRHHHESPTSPPDKTERPALDPRLASHDIHQRCWLSFGARPAKGRRSFSHAKPGAGLTPAPWVGRRMCAVFAMRKLSPNTQNGMSGHGARRKASQCSRTCTEGPSPAKGPPTARDRRTARSDDDSRAGVSAYIARGRCA